MAKKRSHLKSRKWRKHLMRLVCDPARRRTVSELMKRWWKDPAYRRRRIFELRHTSVHLRQQVSLKLKLRWQDPAYRRRMSQALRKGWRDHPNRRKRAAIVRANLGPSIGAQHLRKCTRSRLAHRALDIRRIHRCGSSGIPHRHRGGRHWTPTPQSARTRPAETATAAPTGFDSVPRVRGWMSGCLR